MTKREINLTRAVLAHLHEQDYEPVSEIQIHAALIVSPLVEHPKPSVAELTAVLRHADAEKWVVGVPGRFQKQMRWSLTDTGEAARLALNHE